MTSATARQTLGSVLRLAIPIWGSNLVFFANGIVDVVMAGQLGIEALAAVGLGFAVWAPLTSFIAGIMYYSFPAIGGWIGSRRVRVLPWFISQQLWLALGLGLAAALVCLLMGTGFARLGVDAAAAAGVREYLLALAPGAVLAALFISLRCAVDALGQPRFTLLVAILGVVLNVVLNLGFMHGLYGLPRLGIMGLGVSTTLTLLMEVVVLGLIVRMHRAFQGRRPWACPPRWRHLGRHFRQGLLIGLAFVSEYAVMAVVAVMVGRLGSLALAAHQVAFNALLVLFQAPVALAIATAMLVAQTRAAGSPQDLWRLVRQVLGIALVVNGLIALVPAFFAVPLISLYQADPALIALAGTLLLIMAIGFVPDGMQAVLAGCLRGDGDFGPPFYWPLAVFWLAALPLGWLLSGPAGWGVQGWWASILGGYALIAVLYGYRVFRRFAVPAGRPLLAEQLRN